MFDVKMPGRAPSPPRRRSRGGVVPSFAQPDVNVSASIQRLDERNGLIAVGLHLHLSNVGTVPARFLGIAINVYGQRVTAGRAPRSAQHPLHYEYMGYYRLGPRMPVYSWAYLTKLGDPKSGQETEIDPGTTIDNYRAFYVPQGKFDLLTVGIDTPYTKYAGLHVAHLTVKPLGDVKVVTKLTPDIQQYNITPVSSLDVR